MSVEAEQSEAVFAARDWGMLFGMAIAWGGSFLFMDIGLDHFAPPLIAFGRIAFGAATLALLPAAREPVPRSEWPQIALVGLTWMAVPFLLLAVAQQWIDTGLAGMINATTPLFTALLGALLVRSLPSRLQGAGLVVGFLGVVAISIPSVEGGSNLLGVLFVLAAAALYGLAFNLAAPLQRRHGSLPVTWRAMLVAAVALLPAAAIGAAHSSFGWSSLLAVRRAGRARHRGRVRLVHHADQPRRPVPGGCVDLRRAGRGGGAGRGVQRRERPRRGAVRHRARACRRISDQPAARLGRGAGRDLLPDLRQRAQLVGGELAQEALAHAVQVRAARAARTACGPWR